MTLDEEKRAELTLLARKAEIESQSPRVGGRPVHKSHFSALMEDGAHRPSGRSIARESMYLTDADSVVPKTERERAAFSVL